MCCPRTHSFAYTTTMFPNSWCQLLLVQNFHGDKLSWVAWLTKVKRNENLTHEIFWPRKFLRIRNLRIQETCGNQLTLKQYAELSRKNWNFLSCWIYGFISKCSEQHCEFLYVKCDVCIVLRWDQKLTITHTIFFIKRCDFNILCKIHIKLD